MERITRPAVRAPDGEIHTGDNHIDIRVEASKHGVFLDPFDKQAEGFITDSNRFVNREEAAEIAFSTGQIREKTQRLCSFHLSHLS